MTLALLLTFQQRESPSDFQRIGRFGLARRIDRKLAELPAIRAALGELVERCHGDDRLDCPILEAFEATTH